MTTYKVMSIPNVVDGDTLWVRRIRRVGPMIGMGWRPNEVHIGEVDGVELVALRREGLVGMDLFERDYLGGSKVRLHDGGKGLNTPEKNINRLGWNTARIDLLDWVKRHTMSDGETAVLLDLHTFGRDKYGRLLGDLRVSGLDETYSAVFHMKDKGWEAYR
jgi:hypothetical protein